MKAIIISSYGGPDVLTVAELPDPVPAAGEVLIAVRAFGLNHAEAYMRSGAFGEVAEVTGIECAGTVVADPSGRLAEGTAVVAVLGGMGRTRNGSYAELVTVPASNVVEVSTSLPWTNLVALPEVYATAWAGLRQNLDLRPGQTVLIRGATSALGQAAVNVAAEQGATVPATTRSPDRAALLERIGATTVLIDDGRLADQQPGAVNCVFDLVGNSVLRDSLRLVRPRPGLPARLPRRARAGGGLQPDRRPAERRAVQLLRQRVRAGQQPVSADRDSAHRDDRQGRKWPLPGQARKSIRLRQHRRGAYGDGVRPRPAAR